MNRIWAGMRTVLGDGVVEHRKRSSGTLFPMCEGELVLCGIEENQAEDGTESAPAPEF
jgi:hypothetical protein